MNYTITHKIISNWPIEILVFNFDYIHSDKTDVVMIYISYIEETKRNCMLGKWKIKMKNK